MNIILILFYIISSCLCIHKKKLKENLFNRFLLRAEKYKPPSSFIPDSLSIQQHRDVSTAVFSVGMIANLTSPVVSLFLGTLRKTGFDGDAVVAYLNDVSMDVIETSRKHDSIIYKPKYTINELPGKLLLFEMDGLSGSKGTIAMMRYYLYLWWASKYKSHTTIFLADFRDVLFQSNPFKYMSNLWSPPAAQLTVFLEPLPLKIIYRCPFNRGWIKECYGKEALETVQMNPVSCSGATFGSRDGIMIYSFMMIDQVNATTRAKYGLNNDVPDSFRCFSIGMDQGFHNWLLHSGRLKQIMNVKIFHQGQGPVNTLGAFNQHKSLIKLNLTDGWNILKGGINDTYFINWNGDISPVIHQYDRFKILQPDFVTSLRAAREVLPEYL